MAGATPGPHTQVGTGWLPACAAAQDEEGGGISDRPEDQADVYHTFFGIAGLSLMGRPGLARIDPTFALPAAVVERLAARRAGGPAAQQQQQQQQQQAGGAATLEPAVP